MYGIYTTYEPCIYPGVNIKFFWSQNSGSYELGVCKCNNKCSGKGDGLSDGNCKKITMTDPNKLRLDECANYLQAKFLDPNNKELTENRFDLVFDTVGLEASRQQAIHVICPGGTIIHVGLTQPAGNFNFRKLTIQEITVIGTYCYTDSDFKKSINTLTSKKLGSLKWIEYRELKEGAKAFAQIHNGTCVAPKIILIP